MNVLKSDKKNDYVTELCNDIGEKLTDANNKRFSYSDKYNKLSNLFLFSMIIYLLVSLSSFMVIPLVFDMLTKIISPIFLAPVLFGVSFLGVLTVDLIYTKCFKKNNDIADKIVGKKRSKIYEMMFINNINLKKYVNRIFAIEDAKKRISIEEDNINFLSDNYEILPIEIQNNTVEDSKERLNKLFEELDILSTQSVLESKNAAGKSIFALITLLIEKFFVGAFVFSVAFCMTPFALCNLVVFADVNLRFLYIIFWFLLGGITNSVVACKEMYDENKAFDLVNKTLGEHAVLKKIPMFGSNGNRYENLIRVKSNEITNEIIKIYRLNKSSELLRNCNKRVPGVDRIPCIKRDEELESKSELSRKLTQRVDKKI